MKQPCTVVASTVWRTRLPTEMHGAKYSPRKERSPRILARRSWWMAVTWLGLRARAGARVRVRMRVKVRVRDRVRVRVRVRVWRGRRCSAAC